MFPEQSDGSSSRNPQLNVSDWVEKALDEKNRCFETTPDLINPEEQSAWRDRQLHCLFTGAMDALVIINDQGRCLELNSRACDLFGLTSVELTGRLMADFVYPRSKLEQIWQTLHQQDQAQGEFCLLRADNTRRHIEYLVTANFAPHCHLIVLRDITWVKQKDYLQRLSTVLPVGIAYLDRDRYYRYCNQNYLTWFNLSLDRVTHKSMADVLGESAYQMVKPYVDRVLAGETLTYKATIPDQRGGTSPIQASLIPDVDEQGVVQGYYALVVDLSKHHSLAIALQESELYSQAHQLNITLEQQVQEHTFDLQRAAEFEALLKQITDKVRDSLDENQILETVVQQLGVHLDLEGCDIGIYNQELTMVTITHQFNRSLTIDDGSVLNFVDSPYPDVFARLAQGKPCHFSELVCVPLHSEFQKFTIFACPIIENQTILGDLWLFKPVDATFSDLEVRLAQQVANQCAIALRQSRLHQAVQAQVRELEQLNRLKDDFLSTVSHELRTPMASIKMATELLELHLRQLQLLPSETDTSIADVSEPIGRYFKILKDEGQREINLINDLLDLARIDANTEPLTLTTLAIQNWIPYLLEPFVPRMQQQCQSLTVDLPSNLPLITTDFSYLQRILMELLTNACKYTPPGGTIHLSAQIRDDTLEITVANSGTEISAMERDRIFDRFYRIPNNDPWQHSGTGLGLALVKKLVEYLSGTIRVESGNNQTQFVIQIPLKSM